MSTTKRPQATKPDPMAAHVALGPSNEELIQRQAEAEQRRADEGYPRVEFGADAHDKAADGWGDLDYDPLGLTDPMAQLKHDYLKPGFALKLLSDSVSNRLGKRGYRIVIDENGDPVRMGKMVLGEIPERIAAQRRQVPITRSKEELQNINDKQREDIERMKHDAKGMGLTILEPGEHVSNVGDGQNYQMGIQVERGEQ